MASTCTDSAGRNEPLLEDNTIRNDNSSIPYLEGKQRLMIRGCGSQAPAWIGFVAYGYAAATPILRPHAAKHQSRRRLAHGL
jgi:hypothetical protein